MRDRISVRELSARAPGATVAVAGRVVAAVARNLTVQDDTGCVAVTTDEPARVGAFVVARGSWDGATLLASALHVESQGSERFARADSDATYLGGKRLANLRTRHVVLRTLRAHLDAAGLLEVDTPAMVPCPGLDVHLDAIEVLGAGAPRWLHTSPEYQMKRILTTGLPGIYQIGKAFRRGERGRLHEPEFTMLEWYRTFADAADVMDDTEALVTRVAAAVTGGTRLAGLGAAVDVAPPWERLTVADAFQRYAGVALESVAHDDERFFRVLVEKVEPNLGRGRPTFLTHYPARMASLARRSPTDDRYADRFEAYIDGVELCNGFSELIDPAEQRARLLADQARRQKLGRSVYPLDERFLAALEDGIPPSGGNALGVDRLVMLLCGAKQLDEVIAFASARL